jgi:hypothetical protein
VPDIENRLLEQMLLAFSDRYVVADREDRYTYAFSNSEGRATFFSEPEEFMGKKIGHGMPSEIKDKFVKAVAQARATGNQQSLEYSFQVKDLGEQFFETRVTTTPEDEVILVSRNITRRVQALRRENFIRNSTQILNSSLDYHQTLRALLDVMAIGLGEIIVVRILNEEGRVDAIEFKCSDPEKDVLTSEVIARYGWSDKNQHVGTKAMRSKKATLNRVTGEEYFRNVAQDEEHLKLLMRLGTVSSMAVPLTYGDRILGSLAVMSLKKERHYDESDLSLVEEVARHASVAIDRALAHQRAIKAIQVSEEMMRITSQGIAGPSQKVGHEVGQIISVVSQIEDPNLRRLISKSAKAILRSNEEVEAKLEELKEASSFWLSRKVLESSPHQLQVLLKDAITSCRREADGRSISLEMNFKKDMASILCDAEGLTVVFREWILGLIQVTQRNGVLKFDLAQVDRDVVLTLLRPQYKELGSGFDLLKSRMESLGGRIAEEDPKLGTSVTQFTFTAFNPS